MRQGGLKPGDDRRGVSGPDVLANDSERIAADHGAGVGVAHALLQHPGHTDHEPIGRHISGVVASGSIEAQKDDGDSGTAPPGASERDPAIREKVMVGWAGWLATVNLVTDTSRIEAGYRGDLSPEVGIFFVDGCRDCRTGAGHCWWSGRGEIPSPAGLKRVLMS